MRRLLTGALVGAAVTSCAAARARQAEARCEAFVATLRDEALARVQTLATTPGLRFEAVQFAFESLDPHGGPQPCRLAALVPAGWSMATTTEATSRGAEWTAREGQSRWRIDWVGGSHTMDEWPGFLAQNELLRRRTGTVLRDEAGPRSHVLVTRDDDGVRLLMVRWQPPQPSYVRCEGHLAEPYAPALPAFEAACAATLSLWWDRPGR